MYAVVVDIAVVDSSLVERNFAVVDVPVVVFDVPVVVFVGDADVAEP